jgi:FMN phosphatase YigB (HAD superfamily)
VSVRRDAGRGRVGGTDNSSVEVDRDAFAQHFFGGLRRERCRFAGEVSAGDGERAGFRQDLKSDSVIGHPQGNGAARLTEVPCQHGCCRKNDGEAARPELGNQGANLIGNRLREGVERRNPGDQHGRRRLTPAALRLEQSGDSLRVEGVSGNPINRVGGDDNKLAPANCRTGESGAGEQFRFHRAVVNGCHVSFIIPASGCGQLRGQVALVVVAPRKARMTLLFVFDMDDVLYDYDWRTRMAGMTEITGFDLAELRRRWWHDEGEWAAEAGGFSSPADYLAAFERAMGMPIDEDTWARIRGDAMTPWPESLAAVRLAATFGQVTLLTNNGILAQKHLRAWAPEISEIFGEHLYTSSHYGARKPDPLVFERVLEAYSTSADDTFFADDMLINVEGARGLGITAHHFTSSTNLREAVETFALSR